MDISFTNKKTKKLCTNLGLLQKKWGLPVAKKFKTIVSDIEAADCLHDIDHRKPHPLEGQRKGEYALTIFRGVRLIFVPTFYDKNKSYDGDKFTKIDIIEIVKIEDYHA